ncbi:hypothetical protein TSAR_010904 [Trichomalopsis sarcophagae]|uniref:Uncharacterized protein n=1 Tax=Trichomalopsis sarcophagae TaxID=543379 RepID=A0A232F4S3_9HYME|nr:hypothetical protein TSAR_010904 [Trichomalopsis sarcophagae]
MTVAGVLQLEEAYKAAINWSVRWITEQKHQLI